MLIFRDIIYDLPTVVAVGASTYLGELALAHRLDCLNLEELRSPPWVLDGL